MVSLPPYVRGVFHPGDQIVDIRASAHVSAEHILYLVLAGPGVGLEYGVGRQYLTRVAKSARGYSGLEEPPLDIGIVFLGAKALDGDDRAVLYLKNGYDARGYSYNFV